MNRLKGKVEAYVVSTMEDNQRTSLLDNLTISTEKVEEEAEKTFEAQGEKAIHSGDLVDDLCDSILAILEHELRIIQTRQKPSFWIVAENITPKDTIKMIYRLDIKQTDNNRCQAWLRHSLKEATIGSFMSMLTQDVRLLKEFYKPSAFLRDSSKVESTLNLINCTLSNVQFLVFVDQSCEMQKKLNVNKVLPEVPQEILYTNRKNSSTSLDSSINNKKRKGRAASANIVTIADTPTNHYDDESNKGLSCSLTSDYNLSSSMTETIAVVKEDGTTDESSRAHIVSHFDIDITDQFHEESESSIEQSNTSDNPDIGNRGKSIEEIWTLQMDSVPLSVVNVAVETNFDPSNSAGDQNSDCTHDNASPESVAFPEPVALFNDELRINENENDVEIKEEDSNVDSDDSVRRDTCVDASSVCLVNTHHASLNHSQTSPFQHVCSSSANTTNSAEIQPDVVKIKDHENKLHRIISVIKAGEVKLPSDREVLAPSYTNADTNDDDDNDFIENTDRELSLTELGYINQEGYMMKESPENSPSDFQDSRTGGGSQQLVNILQLSTSGSYNEDYYIPGIHKSPDIETMQQKTQSIPRTREQNRLLESTRNSFTSSTRSYDKTLCVRKMSSSVGSKYDSGTFYSDTDSDTLSTSDMSFNFLTDLGINGDFIGMKEDHFSTPDSFMGFTNAEELENAIVTCKHLIKQSPEQSARRKELVQQLVQLRFKLHEIKDKSAEDVPKNVKKVLGHQFTKQTKVANSISCDSCSSTIYPMLQDVYQCKDCGFHCHRKCLKTLDKACIFNKKVSNESCRLTICPEASLAQQQYRCADCHQRFTHTDGDFQIRLCDYTGQWYCLQCHWNETSVIPARVIHNWDFQLQKVSRHARQILQLRYKRPDIKLQELNPALFNFVDELRSVRNLRENLIMMKEYIQTCRIAKEDRMLLQLMSRQHFVDNSFVYSMQDLVDIDSNVLLPEITKKYSLFVKHIKQNCPLCFGKGFICEKCKSDEIIFPFDENVVLCKHCKATFHRSCVSLENCPRCERTARRKQEVEEDSSVSR